MAAAQKPHIAVFPAMGMGHLLPLIHFSNCIATHHSLKVTFITSPLVHSPPQTAHIHRLAAQQIHFLELPPPPENHSDSNDEDPLVQIFNQMERCREPIKKALESLTDVCAFVTDIFCSATLEASAELRIPGYILCTASAANLCLMLYHPTLDALTPESLADIEGEIEVPGLPPIPAKYFPEPMQCRADPIYGFFLRLSARLLNAEGILINSFSDLEPSSIKALVDKTLLRENKMPEIYPIGPLISHPVKTASESLSWLDRQPAGSVIYVSFGSVCFLSATQTAELALGLEDAGYRFLWALRTPPSEKEGLLPPGFEERTRGRGVVVKSEWVAQVDVLSNAATAGFVTHCGWNSVLESVRFGVPMIAWPIQAEQPTNAFFVVREVGVGVEPRWGAERLVGREEVARVVREVMDGAEGRKVRERALLLKESAQMAAEGSSAEALGRWTSKVCSEGLRG